MQLVREKTSKLKSCHLEKNIYKYNSSNFFVKINLRKVEGCGETGESLFKMVKTALFICLGNICRSPMAHAVFDHLVKESNRESEFKTDSAAIGSWHVGNQPDYRCLKVLEENGITFSHAVRQVTKKDFSDYDYIFGMDNENIRALKSMAPEGSNAKIELLGSYDPEGKLIIRDPYYDDDDKGFYDCYDQCLRACRAFISKN